MLLKNPYLAVYDKARIYLDEDFTVEEKFTALGSMYFIHESITNVEQWDFMGNSFVPVAGREVFSANIEHVPHKLKEKFPLKFFPEQKWSRKGYMQTRWKIFDLVLDFVNIHLFHDICNLLPLIKDPTTYSSCRNRALRYSLSQITKDFSDKLPLFIFGDFNFRLSTQKLVKKLVEPRSTVESIYKKSQSKSEEISRIVYRNNEFHNSNGEEDILNHCDNLVNGMEKNHKILEVGRKTFNMFDKNLSFIDNPIEMYKEFDEEPSDFGDYLTEFKLSFPPSYPFSEDENVSQQYMNTRCPSWCDRIFLNPEALKLVDVDWDNGLVEYHIIGLDACMGDHKPVFLSLSLNDNRTADLNDDRPIKIIDQTEKININSEANNNHDIVDISNGYDKVHGISPEICDAARKRSADIKTKEPITHRRKYNSVVNQDFHSRKRQSVVDSINGIPASVYLDRYNEQWNIFDNAKFDKETELDLKFRLSHRPYDGMSLSANELSTTPESPTRTAQQIFVQAARNIKLAENVIAAFRQSTHRKRKLSESSSEDEIVGNPNGEVNDADMVVETKYITPQSSNNNNNVVTTQPASIKPKKVQCCSVS